MTLATEKRAGLQIRKSPVLWGVAQDVGCVAKFSLPGSGFFEMSSITHAKEKEDPWRTSIDIGHADLSTLRPGKPRQQQIAIESLVRTLFAERAKSYHEFEALRRENSRLSEENSRLREALRLAESRKDERAVVLDADSAFGFGPPIESKSVELRISHWEEGRPMIDKDDFVD